MWKTRNNFSFSSTFLSDLTPQHGPPTAPRVENHKWNIIIRPSIPWVWSHSRINLFLSLNFFGVYCFLTSKTGRQSYAFWFCFQNDSIFIYLFIRIKKLKLKSKYLVLAGIQHNLYWCNFHNHSEFGHCTRSSISPSADTWNSCKRFRAEFDKRLSIQ